MSSLAVGVVIFGSMVWAIFHIALARDMAGGAMLAYLAIEFRDTPAGGKRMIVMAALAALAAALLLPDPGVVLIRGLSEAAFMTGLFTALGMLRDTAETSPLVRACGEAMVRQPPGRRYAVLCLGSHVISMVLNFGVLPLLGLMVKQGNTIEAAAGDPVIRDIRTRRMMTALLRGFAMMTVWSPLSVSFAVAQGAMHGLDWRLLLAVQSALALILMGLGWLLDRFSVPASVRPPPREPSDGDWRPILKLSLFIGAIVAAAVATASILSIRMVIGAVIVVPLAALGWLVTQQGGPATLGASSVLFIRRLTVTLPGFRYESAILSGAMFIGSVLSGFISPETTASLIAGLPVPPLVVVIGMAWGVMLLAQIGIPQIVTVNLLGAALGSLTHLGIHPVVAASGMMGAWGLSACSTTVGAAVLSIARLAEVPSSTVARDWNGRFVIGGALTLALWMTLLSRVIR